MSTEEIFKHQESSNFYSTFLVAGLTVALVRGISDAFSISSELDSKLSARKSFKSLIQWYFVTPPLISATSSDISWSLSTSVLAVETEERSLSSARAGAELVEFSLRLL